MASNDVRPRANSMVDEMADKRRQAHMLLAIKSSGYLVSTLSVALLAAASWKSASQNPLLLACLVVGVTASVLGMFLRWLSYDIEERRKARDGG